MIYITGNDPDAGPLAYASTETEAEKLCQRLGASWRVNHEFSILDLIENYWFPPEWPTTPDTIYIIEQASADAGSG